MRVDYLELLDSAVESPETALHSFMLSIISGQPTLHVYFEGKGDNLFYYRIIKRIINDSIKLRTVICKNKKLVYEFRNALDEQSDEENNIVYFVDKDIDDLSGDDVNIFDDVHSTTTYSIENYIPTGEIINAYCIEGFSINASSEFIPAIIDKYERQESVFFEFFKVMMAWAIFCRRIGQRPNFQNINCNVLFEVNDDFEFKQKMSFSSLFEYFKRKSNVDFSLEDFHKTDIQSELDGLDPVSFVRGKFHLSFFCKFLEQIKNIARKGTGFKQSCVLDDENVMMWCGPRISIPVSIQKFVERQVPRLLQGVH